MVPMRRWPPMVGPPEDAEPVRGFVVERRRLAPRPKKAEKVAAKPARSAPKYRRPLSIFSQVRRLFLAEVTQVRPVRRSPRQFEGAPQLQRGKWASFNQFGEDGPDE